MDDRGRIFILPGNVPKRTIRCVENAMWLDSKQPFSQSADAVCVLQYQLGFSGARGVAWIVTAYKYLVRRTYLAGARHMAQIGDPIWQRYRQYRATIAPTSIFRAKIAATRATS